MKRLSTLILFVLLAFACNQAERYEKDLAIVGETNIIPLPSSVKRIGGEFELSAQTRIVAQNEAELRVAAILNEELFANHGIRLDVTESTKNSAYIKFHDVSVESGWKSEQYELLVSPNRIEIKGDERGMFYGVQSLTQLMPLEAQEVIKIPAAEISDVPRFSYRGMHLDVARHMMPLEFIKKYINLISKYKYNHFHWHLSDDQGWRIEIKQYPRLTEIGSKRAETVVEKRYKPYVGDGLPVEGYYSQDEIRDIVAFAKSRYVTIVPEVDFPGHTSAALAAYPEFGCKKGYPYNVKSTWGGFSDVLCPTDATFSFIENVLDEVMDMFPDSPYIHIGGDEVAFDHWRESPFVQGLMSRENLADERAVHNWFMRRIEAHVSSRGRKAVGWDEVFDSTQKGNSIIMLWREPEKAIEAARAGREVIMTPANYTYFDHPQAARETEPMALGEPVTLQDVYQFDPVPQGLNPNEAKLILGGQGCLWTEFVKTPGHAEYMVFPRVLALAEVLWSRQSARNLNGFLKRLRNEFPRLDRAKVAYRIPKPGGLFDQRFVGDEKALVVLEAPTPSSQIHYTVDGTEPHSESERYRTPFFLNIKFGETKEIKVRVFNADGRVSGVFQARYSRDYMARRTNDQFSPSSSASK